MLTDPVAIEIIANAKQKNVRDPNRSRQHFENIFADFMVDVSFHGNYLDMGPGQYDFGVLAQQRGADQCFAIDYDPAVLKLGEYLGFNVIDGNIKDFSREMVGSRRFQGIINKFSYNCFWYVDADDKHRGFVDSLADSIEPDGWAWIAPWNGVPKNSDLTDSKISEKLEMQKGLFVDKGFKAIPIDDLESRKYGIHGAIANNIIFTYGL